MDAMLLEKTPDDARAVGPASTATDLDRAVDVFVSLRPRLIDIAYRILENASDTEDVVQEAWCRWQHTDRTVVRNTTAFLVTMTTRLALNLAQSARSRRETCAEPWLLERADPMGGPEAGAERGEALEHAVLLLLQSLTPTERAAYVLREAFGYPYQDIAETFLLTTAHARQLVARAHKRITAARRHQVSPTAHRRFVLAFRAAASAGNLAHLEQLLAADLAA